MNTLLKYNFLKEGNLIVWTINLKKGENYIAYFKDKLSKDEITKSHAFRFKKDRNCYIVTRGVLKIILGFYLKKKPEQIVFSYNSYGKPRLFSNEYNLNFNVSHSGDFAIIGFLKNYEIGVDIEKCKTNLDVYDIAQSYFSLKEIEALNKVSNEEKYSAFFRCWTRKEAFIKAQGSGLSFPLNKFTVSIDKEAYLLETLWDIEERLNWHMKSFSLFKDYVCAVATKSRIKSFQINDWDFTNLNLSIT